MTVTSEALTAASTGDDGRRARRSRNRETVIDALLTLHDEGDLAPSAEAIAARAGVSARSVWRYFDDVEDMARAAIARQQERLAPVVQRPIDVGGSRHERVRRAVAHRVDLVAAMGNVGKVARLRAPFNDAVAAELRRVRAELRHLLGAALRPDLAPLPRERAEMTLAAIDVALSYEAIELLRDDHGLDADVLTALLVDVVHAHLAAAEAGSR
ncbi:TetR/AcrR family transcriptional regulator [Actinomarinicola tropica]|nr:TetR/AcrR family transcriptional regulator [Actinomarinicola tropica]